MTHKILHIDASMKPEGSVSRDLTRDIVAKLSDTHGDVEVTYRDLGATPLRETDGDWLAAVNTPADTRDTAAGEIAELSDALIAELKTADTVVIGLPVYNFTVPSQLKIWLDQMARAGETFSYSENGPVGLVKNTRAIVAYTSGGTPYGSDIDFASGYVRHMLGFFGITDVQFVVAEKGVMDLDASLKAANEDIANLVA